MRKLFVLILLTVLCAGCGTLPGRSPAGDFSPDKVVGDLPITLDFSLKNSRGDTFIIHYFWGKLFVTEQVGSRTSAYSVLPSAQDWSEFWRAVESVQLWDWVHTVDPMEPGYWSLDLGHNEHQLSTAGSYAEQESHGGLAYRGDKRWPVLAAAIQRLIHHESATLRGSL